MKKSHIKKYKSFLFLSFCTFFLILSCKQDSENSTLRSTEVETDTLNLERDTLVEKIEKEIEPQIKFSYTLDSITTEAHLDSLLANYTDDEKKLIFAINRIEPVRVKAGIPLVFPDTLVQDFLVYAPFPKKIDFLDTIPKTVLINQRTQAFALYEKGDLKRWGPVSSGKESTPTPNGIHYGNYKAKHKISTVNPDWELPYYFNFMNFEGVGVHQYLLPGFPASHACVRLYMEDAQFIYDWAKQWQLDPTGRKVEKNGTPFMVFGEYDYEQPFPWLQLKEDNAANNLTEEEIQVLKQYLQEYLADERNFRSPEVSEEEGEAS